MNRNGKKPDGSSRWRCKVKVAEYQQTRKANQTPEEREQRKQYAAQYYQDNREQIREYARKYYQENTEEEKKRAATYRAENLERRKATQAAYRERNREKLRERERARYWSREPERLETRAEREREKELAREEREALARQQKLERKLERERERELAREERETQRQAEREERALERQLERYLRRAAKDIERQEQREVKAAEREAKKELKMLREQKTDQNWRDSQLPFNGEFEALITIAIKKYHASQLRSLQKSAHLDWEDLRQEARTALWLQADEFEGVTDQYERGRIAFKITNAAIGKMLRENAYFRTRQKTDLLPILTADEMGLAGDLDTLDLAANVEADHADIAEWDAAISSLTPRSQKTLLMRRLGFTWKEIADEQDLDYTTIQLSLTRDLNRHGLLDELGELAHLTFDQWVVSGRPAHEYQRVAAEEPVERLAPWVESPEQFNFAETKVCEGCGVEYPRKADRSGPNWNRQRFCSQSCLARWKHRTNVL